MALESATYISDLVATNPTAGDNKTQGDDHIRLIKAALKATFPDINGAVGLSDEQLNLLDTKAYANDDYIKFPSGLIIQWGSGTTAGATTKAITFPLEFPVSCFTVVPGNNFTSTSGVTICAVNRSTTGFTLASSVTAMLFSWIAVGI